MVEFLDWLSLNTWILWTAGGLLILLLLLWKGKVIGERLWSIVSNKSFVKFLLIFIGVIVILSVTVIPLVGLANPDAPLISSMGFLDWWMTMIGMGYAQILSWFSSSP
ncbi:hypothetical protein LCGC14_0176110 [marine sediment metagenome]|uniref:Uncharacterized protein n=1 Tax=marine sediment metagenome TaxID=412755 RepID=A0A0F9V7P5_9ZZZZ